MAVTRHRRGEAAPVFSYTMGREWVMGSIVGSHAIAHRRLLLAIEDVTGSARSYTKLILSGRVNQLHGRHKAQRGEAAPVCSYTMGREWVMGSIVGSHGESAAVKG
ncbi:hypothetical protein J6590_078828 [Homalodisca vitripennis]|nr:hypothetical protein J6590_078828 [Homalodisca vitripennis]